MDREPSSELLVGRRQIDGIPEATLFEDWKWSPEKKRWYIKFSLTIGTFDPELIPNVTFWYLVVPSSYPEGKVKVYPAKDGGITETFSHQSYNGEGEADSLWRTGDLCLQFPLSILHHSQMETEPTQAHLRIVWHIQRAIEWLIEASKDNLIRNGERFELPDVPNGEDYQFVFVESPESYGKWQDFDAPHFGLLEVGEVSKGNQKILFADTFHGRDEAIFQKTIWGEAFDSRREIAGIWTFLSQSVIEKPWSFPINWGRLFPYMVQQDVTVKPIFTTSIDFFSIAH